MKTIKVFLLLAVLALAGCEKKEMIVKSSGDDPTPTPTPTTWIYAPEMRIFNSDGVYLRGSGLSAIYEYKGSFSLNCFKENPGAGPFYMASVYNKDGITGTLDDVIYADKNGSFYWYDVNTGVITPSSITDHTGFDFNVLDGRFFFSLRTSDVAITGCPIKYMPAIYNGNKMIWMHLPGNPGAGNDITNDLFKSGKITNLN
jgi:hypothetical protein